jgi:hypothetical protein
MFGFLPRQSGCTRWLLRATTITLPVGSLPSQRGPTHELPVEI